MRRGLLFGLALLLLLPLVSGAQSMVPGITMWSSSSGTTLAPVYNVKTGYGAKGDGTTDDTAAIQAALTAVTSCGTVFLPVGTYKVTSDLLPNGCTTIKGDIQGRRLGASNDFVGTVLDASSLTGGVHKVIYVNTKENVIIEDLAIKMAAQGSIAQGSGDASPGAGGIEGIYFGSTKYAIVRNVTIEGGNDGMPINGSFDMQIESCRINGAKGTGLWIGNGSANITVVGGLYQNSGRSDGIRDGNIVIGDTSGSVPYGIRLLLGEQDEGGNASINIINATDVYIAATRLFYSKVNSNGTGPGYGILVGSPTVSPARVTIDGVRIEPFGGSGAATNTILLYGSGHRLLNVSTNPDTGGDILDNAPDTQYVNVNGSSTNYQSIIADATIPYGSVVMPDAGTDGRFDINTGSATLAIGVVQGRGDTAQGTAYPVASTGRAYVRMQEDAGATRGHWAIVSATAGLVTDSATVTTIGLNVGKFLRSEGVTATINPAGCTGSAGCINTALNTPSPGAAGQITLGVDVAALGWTVGDAIQYWNSGGTSPTGLTDGQTYFLASVSTTKVTLTATKGSTTIVVPSSQGTDATQYLIRLPLVAVSLQ